MKPEDLAAPHKILGDGSETWVQVQAPAEGMSKGGHPVLVHIDKTKCTYSFENETPERVTLRIEAKP
jgi:hypothetical protein